MITLWFPSTKDHDTVLGELQKWMTGNEHHQQVQDWINSRFPSFDKCKVYLNDKYILIDTACGICFEPVSDMHSACNHFFHKRCIKQWLLKSKTCPLCRSSVTL